MADTVEQYKLALGNFVKEHRLVKGVEIGLAWGYSADAFLRNSTGTLISIDLNDDNKAVGNLRAEYGERWTFITGDSAQELAKLSDKFDYIYVDGDHSYGAVVKDLAVAITKLAKGGYIICDDYGQYEDTKNAIDEFAKSNSLKLEPLSGHPNGAVVLWQ